MTPPAAAQGEPFRNRPRPRRWRSCGAAKDQTDSRSPELPVRAGRQRIGPAARWWERRQQGAREWARQRSLRPLTAASPRTCAKAASQPSCPRPLLRVPRRPWAAAASQPGFPKPR